MPVREVDVECLTLDDVLVPPAGGAIHWLKIDVEGYEREALQGWQGSVKPWIVVVESTLPSTQVESQQGWETLLVDHGYTLAYFDGLNRFYVSLEHAELLDAFRHGPTVFDGFTLSGTATAPFSVKLLCLRNGGPLQNDATPGVQAGDYAVWKANFGKTAGGGIAIAVPEPSTLLLFAKLVTLLTLRRKSPSPRLCV